MKSRPSGPRSRRAGLLVAAALVLTVGACAHTQPPSPCTGFYEVDGHELSIGNDLYRSTRGSFEYFGTVRKAEMREVSQVPGREMHYWIEGGGSAGWYKASAVGGWIRCP